MIIDHRINPVHSRDSTCPSARAALVAARQRYHALPVTDRPPVQQPHNLIGLFTRDESAALALAGQWPLSESALARFTVPPRENARRRRRARDRVATVARDVLVAELEDAVKVILERHLPAAVEAVLHSRRGAAA